MMEAGDLNEWLGDASSDVAPRLHLRASSFCMAQGDLSDDAGYHQGLSSFAPHYTLLQPPGLVHAMVSSSWQPNGISATINYANQSVPDHWGSYWNNTLTTSAAASDDGSTVVVRMHSNATVQIAITISFKGTQPGAAHGAVVQSVLKASVLTASSLQAVNSPSAPGAVAEKPLATTVSKGGVEVVLPPHSFATVTLSTAQ
jgi:hypothetical protein